MNLIIKPKLVANVTSKELSATYKEQNIYFFEFCKIEHLLEFLQPTHYVVDSKKQYLCDAVCLRNICITSGRGLHCGYNTTNKEVYDKIYDLDNCIKFNCSVQNQKAVEDYIINELMTIDKFSK